jgi:hypothetical protein
MPSILDRQVEAALEIWFEPNWPALSTPAYTQLDRGPEGRSSNRINKSNFVR